MSNNKKDAELIPDPAIPSKWKMKYDGKEGTGPANYPKITLDHDSGPHLITFTLPANSTVKFSADPIWVAAGSNSPTQKGLHDQIAAVKVFDAGKTLVILDRNTQDVELGYRLNFDGYGSLDPIIDNGGGTGGGPAPPPPPPPPAGASGFMGIDASAVQILAVVLLFLLGIWLGRISARA